MTIQDLGSNGELIAAVATDTTGEVGGTVFDDEDVSRFDGTHWTLEFDGSVANESWAAADLAAVMVPEPSIGWMLMAGVAGILASWRPPAGVP